MSQSSEALLKLILPEGLLNYFTINHLHQDEETILIFLEEINTPPSEYESDKLVSKGFFPEASIQDFPIRGKAVHLIVKRRRWTNTRTGEIVSRDWNLVSEGTRMTSEFAAFLKEISGYRSGKL